jgi:integrase
MFTPDSAVTEFFRDHYSLICLRGPSPNTLRLHELSIRRFRDVLGRDPKLADFTQENLARFCAIRRRTHPPTTVNREAGKLVAQWRAACRKGVLCVWPDHKPEREPERIPQAWTQDEINRLFAAAYQERRAVGDVPGWHWWPGLLFALWDSGERIGPMRKLQWDDLDSNGWLVVRAEYRKGRTRDRGYQLHPQTMAAIEQIRRFSRSLIFAWPLSDCYIYKRLEEILHRAGLPTDRKSKFHRIRKSHASHAEAAGMNATELLDHSSRQVTKAYLDPRIVLRQNATDVLFRPGTSPQGL